MRHLHSLVIGIFVSCLAVIPAVARSQNVLEVAKAVWTDSVNRTTKQYNKIYRLTAHTGPLYLWTQIKGSSQLLGTLRRTPDGSIWIRHLWFRYDSDQWDSGLDKALYIGRKSDLTKLKYEVDAQGFFLWNTWSGSDNLDHGLWRVEVVYGDSYQPVMCRHSGADVPCTYTIEVR